MVARPNPLASEREFEAFFEEFGLKRRTLVREYRQMLQEQHRDKLVKADAFAKSFDALYDCLNEFPEYPAACAEHLDATFMAKLAYEQA